MRDSGRIDMRHGSALAVALMGLALAGCNTSSLSLASTGATAPVVSVVEADASVSAPVVKKPTTGTYPSFNTPLTSANVQMENAAAKSLEAQLAALGKARASGQVTQAEYDRQMAELRKLGAQHGADAQAQIEQ